MPNPIRKLVQQLGAGQERGAEPGQAQQVVQDVDQPQPMQAPAPLATTAPVGVEELVDTDVIELVNEIKKLSPVGRALLARELGNLEPLRELKPEDWANLIRRLVKGAGDVYAEAFIEWCRLKGIQ